MKTMRTTAAVAATLLTIGASAGMASADTTSLQPVSIVPVCVDTTTDLSQWDVTNPNNSDITINWTNLDDGTTGTYDAPAGDSTFNTEIQANDPNNTTQFVSNDGTTSPVTRNAHMDISCDLSSTSTGTGSTGGNTGTGTTTTPPAGKGGDSAPATVTTTSVATPAAATTASTAAAPELAYTGASRVLPYTAAGLLAMFTAAATFVVRKSSI